MKRPNWRLLGRSPPLYPVKDPTIQLGQAATMLKLIEAVGTRSELGQDGDQLLKAMKFARKLVEQVIAKLKADKAAGAKRRKAGAS